MMTNAPRWIGLAVLLSGAVGCAATWDEIMSRDRDFRYITGINKPKPLDVLQNSNDGVRRAEALGELHEPLRHGGNAQDQKAYLDILAAAAMTDAEPLCRLSAIRALGKYRDPRAARVLEEVYQQQITTPKMDQRLVVRFNNDINAFIRKEALVALGQTKDADAVHLLVRVARQPGPPINADLTDRQQTQDEKAVAIRALKNYTQQASVDALVHILRTEKDVALRDCALQSLEQVTGKKWPADRDSWQTDDVRPRPAMASDNQVIQWIGAWMPK